MAADVFDLICQSLPVIVSTANTQPAQGLAHYLEHMLFMGSAKYPDENEYDCFISERGGSTNAFTETEFTLYHFDILPDHLEKVGSACWSRECRECCNCFCVVLLDFG